MKIVRQTCPSLALVAVLVGFGITTVASAQTTTATLRGTVSDEGGAPIAGASLVAVHSETGLTVSAESGPSGSYSMTLPPGPYEITVAATGKESLTEGVRAQVGQALTIDFELGGTARLAEEITVTAEYVPEFFTSELATNVSTEQIEQLPQNNRNFLSFAALAPGVGFTPNQDEAGQKYRSGGLDSRQVNVFVDGLSFKNDLLQGGAFMQDSSRGNPFPQNAVQEFRVLSQNYKAEYEKAAAAVITAVTKSGGNEVRGDLLYLFQDKGMVEQDDFSKDRGEEKPEYERWQGGLSVGGPVIRDTMHFFLSYEQQEQDRFATVLRGGSFSAAPQNVQNLLAPYPTGLILQPFESKLYFGKLSWQPGGAQHLDVTLHKRDEQEVRGFGTQRVEEGAESLEIETDAATARHSWYSGSLLNEAGLTYQKLGWSPTGINTTTPRQNYIDILDIGGRDATQDFEQDKIGLRDDLSYRFSWHGEHGIKTGVSFNQLDYKVEKTLFSNALFEFRRDEQWQFPFQARLGFGDPALEFSNEQLGLYLQDDYEVGAWTFNVGLRWDYESNMINNDYTTPPELVAALQSGCRTYGQPVGGQTTWCLRDFLDLDTYTTDGSDRDDYYGMLQPRLGFSWDATGDGKTVVFGGWGKYYDRVILNDIFDEQYRQQFKIFSFCFSADGSPTPNCGVPAIRWDPSYLSAAGLAGLIARGQAPGPEVFLVSNDLRPPRSDQWTLGVRRQINDRWNGSLAYAGVRGYNGMSWFFGDNPPGTAFNDRFGGNVGVPGYARVFVTSQARRQWYDAIFLTLDRRYGGDRLPWGFNLAYTYADAEQTGTDNPGEGVSFGAFDYGSSADFYRFPASNVDEHRVVASGTIGLPFDFRASSFMTLGSGAPFTIFDDSVGPFTVRWNEGDPPKDDFLGSEWAYASLDLRLDWEVAIRDLVTLGLIGEVFNATDFDNGGCFESFKPRLPSTNARFGQANCEFNTRRFQMGATLKF